MALNGDEFIDGLRSFGAGITVREAELKKIMDEKDAIIAEKDALIIQTALVEAKDDMIGKLDDVIAYSAGPNEINELKVRLALAKAEKELKR